VNYSFKANNYIDIVYIQLSIFIFARKLNFNESGVAYFILLNQKPKIWVVVVVLIQ